MRYSEQTGKSIPEAFQDFHRDNPRVYELFRKFALWLIETKGKKKISSKLIINRIRWEIYLETKTEDKYRINDAFTSHYARLFILEFPKYSDRFELRRLRCLGPSQFSLELPS